MMLWILVPLLVLAAGAAAGAEECVACVQGRCHSRRALLSGSTVTDQLAIDRTDNILYTQLDHRTIVALFLDEDRQLVVNVANSTGLAVDQETQALYTSQDRLIHVHTRLQSTFTKYPVFTVDRPTTPARLRFEDTLYIINKDGSSAYYSKLSRKFTGYDNLESYVVTDMANVKDITNWFFISNNKLYRFILSWPPTSESSHLISKRKHALSISASGDNYFSDVTRKIIHKLDRSTMKLKKYAVYKGPSVEDFVFDKNGNIVFRDAEGGVGQWLPGQARCVVRHHREIHVVDDSKTSDNWYNATSKADAEDIDANNFIDDGE